MVLIRSFKPLIEHHVLRVRVKYFLFSFRIMMLRFTLQPHSFFYIDINKLDVDIITDLFYVT